MLPKLNQKAQTTAEYAILIAIVVGAVVAMQVYIKRGFQGRVRNAVDHVGAGGLVDGVNAFTFTSQQYEPYYLASDAESVRHSQQKEILGAGGKVGRSVKEMTRQDREQVTGWESGKDTADKAKAKAQGASLPVAVAQTADEAVLP